MNRSLDSLSLSSIHKTKLKEAGYEYVSELAGTSADQLLKDIDVPKSEAIEILSLVGNDSVGCVSSENVGVSPCGMGSGLCGLSALDLLKKEKQMKRIISFSQNLDDMLDGGIPVGKITEICGSPGVGKTQLCIQLCVDATIPCVFGGPGGESIFIDTEGSFISQRVVQIAEATVSHIQAINMSSNDKDKTEAASVYKVEAILSKIHYYRCHSRLQLIALTNILHSFISEHPSVCLVVIDSIASPFRHGFDNLSHRTRLLNGLSQTLIKLAIGQELAVVLTNQMTTRADAKNGSQLVPALGDSWGHASTIRLLIYWEDEQRCVYLFKSPSCREARINFQITKDGIRDIPVVEGSSKPDNPTHFPSILTQGALEDPNDSFCEDELDSLFQDASVCLDFADIGVSPSSKRARIADN